MWSVNALCLALFRKVKKGTLLIDSSTIDPAVSKEMAVAAEKMGAVFMDAPVSGGNVSPKDFAVLVSKHFRSAKSIFSCLTLWFCVAWLL